VGAFTFNKKDITLARLHNPFPTKLVQLDQVYELNGFFRVEEITRGRVVSVSCHPTLEEAKPDNLEPVINIPIEVLERYGILKQVARNSKMDIGIVDYE
jgi:hypothetical protein